MPAPAYVTNENIQFNSVLDPCVLIKTVGSDNHFIKWVSLNADDQAIFDAFVTAIGGTLPIGAPFAGYQTVDFGGVVVGGNPTGLANDATIYTADIIVDGVNKPINIVGSAAQTFTALITELNVDLGVAAVASIVGGNIVITSATSGNVSTVFILDHFLFRLLVGMKKFKTPINGASSFEEALQLNYAENGTTFYNLFKGLIIVVGPKPPLPPDADITNTEIYWATSWKKLFDDSPA
jgi:hypothetical protein